MESGGEAEVHFEPASWALSALSVAAALAYGFVFERQAPSLARALVKALFLAALAAALHLAHAPGLFVVALICAAVGDFLLAFDKPIALPLGMLAFLIMQALYTLSYLDVLPPNPALAWLRHALAAAIGAVVLIYLVWLWREPRPGRSPVLAALAIAGALAIGGTPTLIALSGKFESFGMGGFSLTDPNLPLVVAVLIASIVFVWVRRDLGAVKLAGMVYAAVILQMAYTSLWLPWARWPVMLGAFLFLLSDGVLSAELFRMAPDAPARRITGPAVWWTYAAAQLLIAYGVACIA
ncbi:MAG TPA: lysoplasmalogenase family protein [Caulobacterales bacterium]|nr:lysoplasmalogenase family protein [Caulobacterales bacterium]